MDTLIVLRGGEVGGYHINNGTNVNDLNVTDCICFLGWVRNVSKNVARLKLGLYLDQG